MMQVGIVRVRMSQGRMSMEMRVRRFRRIVQRMFMLVMEVMHMAVFVIQRLMLVCVVVRFGHVEINPDPHQQAGADQSGRDRLAEHERGEDRSDEGRG